MAFECQDNYSIVATFQPNFIDPRPKKSLEKPISSLLRLDKGKEGEGEGEGEGNGGLNGRRLITDLPPALLGEILHCLDAKDLGVVSCVSTVLYSLATNHLGWKKFYFERWGPPLSSLPDSEISWKELFVEREIKRCFMGSFSMDALRGHTEAVLAVFLLQSAKLVFTGGYDSVVRMWNMEDGILLSASRPLGCTVRAIAADNDLLVVGGSNAFIRCWAAVEGNHPHCFDITRSELRLGGHEGPITCLALDASRIFSGSWDMSIRVWDRVTFKCLKEFTHGDWVWSLVPRGPTIVSTAGSDAYVWDIATGDLVNVIYNTHVGKAYALACSYSGKLLFTGGEDNCIHMFEVGDDDDDIRKTATWKPHNGPVNSLAFEFPWLVSCSCDGRLALINVRKLLRCSRVNQPCTVEPPQRMLHGFANNLFSVTIGADRIVSGGEDGVVRVWDFTQALEVEKRSRALKGIRLENRLRRQRKQIEMNGKSGRLDQSLVLPKKNLINGSRNGIWNGKQRDKKS